MAKRNSYNPVVADDLIPDVEKAKETGIVPEFADTAGMTDEEKAEAHTAYSSKLVLARAKQDEQLSRRDPDDIARDIQERNARLIKEYDKEIAALFREREVNDDDARAETVEKTDEVVRVIQPEELNDPIGGTSQK